MDFFMQQQQNFQQQVQMHHQQQQLVVQQSHHQMFMSQPNLFSDTDELDGIPMVDEEIARIKAEVEADIAAFDSKKEEEKKEEEVKDYSRFFGEYKNLSEKIEAAREALKKEIEDYESNRKDFF